MIRIMGKTPHATTLRDLVTMRAALGDKPLLICRDETLTYADAGPAVEPRPPTRFSNAG